MPHKHVTYFWWKCREFISQSLVFAIFHPQLSSLICQNLKLQTLLLRASHLLSVHLPSLLKTIKGIISISFVPVLTAACIQCLYDPTLSSCTAAELSAASSWSLALAEIIPCGTSSAKYTYSPQTSMGLLIGFKIMRWIIACRFNALIGKQFYNPLISKMKIMYYFMLLWHGDTFIFYLYYFYCCFSCRKPEWYYFGFVFLDIL